MVLDELSALPRPPRILLFTVRMDEVLLHRLNLGGVAGLMRKSANFDRDLRAALTAIIAGESYFPSEVTEAMRCLRSSPDAFFKILSPIEQHLVSLIGLGCTDGMIARCTGRSVSTIRVHYHNIMAKLQLRDRHELLRWARAKGFANGCYRTCREPGGKVPRS